MKNILFTLLLLIFTNAVLAQKKLPTPLYPKNWLTVSYGFVERYQQSVVGINFQRSVFKKNKWDISLQTGFNFRLDPNALFDPYGRFTFGTQINYILSSKSYLGTRIEWERKSDFEKSWFPSIHYSRILSKKHFTLIELYSGWSKEKNPKDGNPTFSQRQNWAAFYHYALHFGIRIKKSILPPYKKWQLQKRHKGDILPF